MLLALQPYRHSSHRCKRMIFLLIFGGVYCVGCDFILVLFVIVLFYFYAPIVLFIHRMYCYYGSVSDHLGPSAFNKLTDYLFWL